MRRLTVALNGFGTKFIEKAKPVLLSRNYELAFVKEDRDYRVHLQKLCRRILHVTERHADWSAQHFCLLVSCEDDSGKRSLEDDCFFPAVRRIRVDRTVQAKTDGATRLAKVVDEAYVSWQSSGLPQQLRARTNAALLLPLRNARCRHLTSSLKDIYENQSVRLRRSAERSIALQRGGGMNVSGLTFTGATNTDQHPLRRNTDSVECDLKGRFRLGHGVPLRFEFDVTCNGGLAGREFWQCNGHSYRAPAHVTHVNIRMNDDFAFG